MVIPMEGEDMNSEQWKSDSARDEPSRPLAEGDGFMEDVLRRTLDAGQADDVLETVAQLQRSNPRAKPDEIDTMTRFVIEYLRRCYPNLPLKNEKVLTMASTIAQSLIDDPVASERMRALWTSSN